MKKITELLKEDLIINNFVFNSFNEEFLAHIIIEKWKSLRGKLNVINETHGIINNTEEISEIVYNKFKHYIKLNSEYVFTITKKQYPIIIVSSITFILKHKSGECEGDFDVEKFEKDKKLDITIEAGKQNDEYEVRAMILHELLHLYSAVFSLKHNLNNKENNYHYTKTMLDRVLDDNYFNYNKLNSDDKNIIKEIKSFLYHLNKEEINAFVGQIKIELDKENYKTPQEGIEKLYNNQLWKNLEIIDYYINNLDVNKYNDFYKFYKKIIPNEKLTPNKLIKKLKYKIDKAKNQLFKQMSKQIADKFIYDLKIK